jgi:uncharacterized membrane protein
MLLSHRPSMPSPPSPSRLESFSDGVIAVIITIMVLEFKVPHADGPAGMLSTLPTFAVYLLSFVFTGIYWINHHHLVGRLKRVDSLILWSNLGFLFTLSLLPFFTNYLVEKGVHAFPVALYAVSQLLDGITFTLLSKALIRHIRHAGSIYDDNEAQEQVAENKKAFISLAMYLIAIPTAYWRPWPALILVATVTLVWIVPTFGVKPVQYEPLRPNH